MSGVPVADVVPNATPLQPTLQVLPVQLQARRKPRRERERAAHGGTGHHERGATGPNGGAFDGADSVGDVTRSTTLVRKPSIDDVSRVLDLASSSRSAGSSPACR